MSRKGVFRQPVGLRCRCVRDFSDSFYAKFVHKGKRKGRSLQRVSPLRYSIESVRHPMYRQEKANEGTEEDTRCRVC